MSRYGITRIKLLYTVKMNNSKLRNLILASVVGLALITAILLLTGGYNNHESRQAAAANKRKTVELKQKQPVATPIAPGKYIKPELAEIKAKLTPLEFEVTQHEATEPAYDNEYERNEAEGIYVDVVSGEPLFSSKDKYDSQTGWPSFTQPITPDAVAFKTDYILGYERTEVRSKVADSHLGHRFDEGPEDRGGKRYCMNSAAMVFSPKEKLTEAGYGEFTKLFE